MPRPGIYAGKPKVSSSGRPFYGCCCGGSCPQVRGTVKCGNYPSGGRKYRPRYTCTRFLIWTNAIWNGEYFTSSEIPILGGSSMPEPNEILRSSNCCEHEYVGSYFPDCIKAPSEVNTFPVVTDCWNLNPTTGTSDFNAGDCLDLAEAYENEFRRKLSVDDIGKRFSVLLACNVFCWAYLYKGSEKPEDSLRHLYGGVAKVQWLMKCVKMKDGEEELWDNYPPISTC